MVTFSIPGDNDGDAPRGTPRPRPPLPFAKRAYVSSPYNSKRLGTPQSAPARRLLARDEIPSNSLNRSSIATARNIFRASSITDSPPVSSFSPSINLPANTPKKVFAPGATPEPSRVYRESTAQATPRGMAAKATSKELFKMRIEDPDPELSGEALTNKIPKDWNSKGSIYADQFLAHLCPPHFDDEQRRQFFCILDLRRLKYAANEIFSKKDWKLNVANFAKEFEKSRSIILLRYGLYEFQNVKPSREVLKRWRREHGLPEPEDEQVEATPSKPVASKKRKVDEETDDTFINKNKRRAPERNEEAEEAPAPAPAPTPALNKNKRKASVSEEPESQPSKLQKATPSAAKSLFEKIANKASSTPVASPAKSLFQSVEEPAASKPNPFAASTNGGPARSVFQNLKPSGVQSPGGSNIFSYLSDAGSAKNSGAEADAESETDSDEPESQDAEKSDEPSIASGVETGSQVGSSLFGQKTLPPSGLAASVSSAPGTRESTPGRSLFDRVTKGTDGQPLRAEESAEPATVEKTSAPADQTWNPSTTPLKFAPSTSTPQTSSLFGNSATSAPASSLFAPKTSTSSNIFGAPKQDKPAEKEATPAVEESDKTGGESDKENESQPAKKSLFEAKPPAAQPSFSSSLFQPKPAETLKAAEPTKPASNLFGAAPKADDKPAASSTTNLFGVASKPAETSSTEKPAETSSTEKPAVMQSSTLFGAKPAATDKPAGSETPKPTTSLFGNSATPASASNNSSTSLFGAKPTSNPPSLFGNAASTAPTQSLWGAPTITNKSDSTAPKQDGPVTAAPTFSFGAASGGDKANGTSSTPLFGAPKSPTTNANSNSMFSGSPMKQDGPSPAKKAFGGASTNGTGASTPIFSFGNASSTPAAPMFGGSTSTAVNGTANATPSFGAAPSSNSGSGGFNFNFGGASQSSGTGFNNPFASGTAGGNNSGSAPASTSGGMFSFGANTAAPSGSTPFQFGDGNKSAATPAFGAGSSNDAAKPMFGGASGSNGAPAFNFTAASPQPQGAGAIFGSGQAAPAFGNLQPPAGGSTTGTNTPFSLGGGSSLATTPAGGTPEPTAQAEGTNGTNDEDGEKHEQINLTEGAEADEEVLHEVRAKVLKFVPASKDEGDETPKSKSPWSTQGIGPLRVLKHKETNAVRLLLRAEPRGHVALNRALLPTMDYKADVKYVKVTTSNEQGDGLETWMIQVKNKDLATELAGKLEEHKKANET